MPIPLRGVFDTNVVLAAHSSSRETSPAAEIFLRWRRRDFTLLHSADILAEYSEKLLALGFQTNEVSAFLRLLVRLGESVSIGFFHTHPYPVDADDIMFLLCALNGRATHLVSYDAHLLTLRYSYRGELNICKPLEFLFDCREAASE